MNLRNARCNDKNNLILLKFCLRTRTVKFQWQSIYYPNHTYNLHIKYALIKTRRRQFEATNHQPRYALRNFNISREVRVLCGSTTQELPSTVAAATAPSYEEGYILSTCLPTSYLATIYTHKLSVRIYCSLRVMLTGRHFAQYWQHKF
jgi:hypothetical protein